MKNYSAKSSAVRAAKKEFGGEWETKAAVMLATSEQGGGWVIIPRQVEPAQNVTLSEALAESGESLEQLMDDVATPDPKAERKAATRANRALMGFKLSAYEGKEGPTKGVWRIAGEMVGKSRKEVIAACIEQGIGAGTARTQYQAWFSAMKAQGAL